MAETDKLEQLLLYVCSRCDDPGKLGATKLNKILWYADAIAFLRTGKPITNASYIKRQFGPVPRRVPEVKASLLQKGAIIERIIPVGSFQQKQIVSLVQADISVFSPEEISLVDEVVRIITENHTARSISDLTHDNIWEAAKIGEEIPLYALHAQSKGEVDELDMAWAQEVVKRIERSATPQPCTAPS